MTLTSKAARAISVLVAATRRAVDLLSLTLVACLALGTRANSAEIFIGAAQNLNWSSITNGSGTAGLPDVSDAITVGEDATLTVDSPDAVCSSIQLGQSNSGPGTLVFAAGSQLTVSGTLSIGATGSYGAVSMTAGGTLVCQSLIVPDPGSVPPSVWLPGIGTVQLTSDNTLPGSVVTNFYNLTVSAGVTQLGTSLLVTNLVQNGGDLDLGGYALSVISAHRAGTNSVFGSGAYAISNGVFETGSPAGVAGNLATSGTQSLEAVAFVFDGAVPQVTSAAMPGAVSSLLVSNAAGVTLSQSVTNSTLVLANGKLTVPPPFQLTVANADNSAISGGDTNSYVIGRLEKSFDSGVGQTFTFPIGTASAYTPVTCSNLDIGGTGWRSIALESADGDHPQLGGSDIAGDSSVNRHWTLTQSASVFTNYTLTFNYPAADLDPGAIPAQFIVEVFVDSAWSPAAVAGTPSAECTVVTNVAAVSADFAIGNPKRAQSITFPSPGNRTYGDGPILLDATASSALPVDYAVSGPATLTNGTLRLDGVGSVSIVATQSGDANYLAATAITNTITVAPKSVSIESGIVALDKVYDATSNATVAWVTVVLSGVVTGDAVDLVTNDCAALFASAEAGTNIPVFIENLTLAGTSATNYVLVEPVLAANILPASTIGVVVSSVNPALPGADITLTATLSVVQPGAGKPTGDVTFKADGDVLGTAVLNDSATAALTTGSVPHGAHTITAEYAGDANFRGSTNTLSPEQVVNTPPIAGDVALNTTVNTGLVLAESDLLAHCSDGDTDTLAVVSIARPSAQGGQAALTNSALVYSPPNNFVGNDSLSYTVVDPFAAAATGVVHVTIGLGDCSSVIHGVTWEPEAGLQILAFGKPGLPYDLEATTNLADSSSWVKVGEVTAGSGGGISCAAPIETGIPQRFYRLKLFESPEVYAGRGSIAPTSVGYVTSGDVLPFETNQAWTITAAMKSSVLPDSNGASVIACKIDQSPEYRGYELWVDYQGHLVTECISDYSVDNRIAVIGSTMVVNGTWHYVAATYDGSSTAAGLKLYVDGVEETTTVWVDNLNGTITNSVPLTVGVQLTWPAGEYFRGWLDEVTISDVARDPSYLAAHATPASLPPVDANLQLYYRFDEASGLSAFDASGHGRIGKLTANIRAP